MAVPGSPRYRVGLIIAQSQPFHNGLVKIIGDAMMTCDDVIISFVDYDTNLFDYNSNQKFGRLIYGDNKNISYFGTKHNNLVVTPKQIIEETLLQLEEANYNMPTHFFTHMPHWVEPAKELQLNTQHISSLINVHSRDILTLIQCNDVKWETKIPYCIIDEVKSYIATKKRNNKG